MTNKDEEIKNEEDIVQEVEEINAKEAAKMAAEIENEETTENDETNDSSGEDLEETIKQRDETIAIMHDKLQRQIAEFDNFRKRTDKEKSEMFATGATEILKKLLPIVDNFERGFNTIPEGEEKTQFAVGMDMVYKQLLKMLEECNVTPIKALGEQFDTQFHNAVQHVEKEDAGENVIIEEYEKGYMYGDTVLRHSMVIVAN